MVLSSPVLKAVFANHLQTKKEEKEASPQVVCQPKEVEQRDRTNSGIINPGMEARTTWLAIVMIYGV